MLLAVLEQIKGYLNNEKIKYKKIIHRLMLTMKHKEKRHEWRKVVFWHKKKFNLDCPDGFQKDWRAKSFQEENY